MTDREKHFKAVFKHLIGEHGSNYLFMCPWGRRYFQEQLASAIFHRYKTNLAIKLLCKLSLYFLAKAVLGYKDLKRFPHFHFCEHIQTNISKNTNILPRGYFKTTLSTKSGSIFCIINDPNIRILLTNATATNAELFLKEIKANFESNPYFKLLFPELIPQDFSGKKSPWSNNKMQVARTGNFSEPTIYAVGIETNVTSGHFNLIIKDDLVNEDHLSSPEMMKKPIEWEKMSNSLYIPDSDPRKKMDWSTGTRWSFFDYMAERLKVTEEDEQFILSCYDEKGVSTFPEKFPEQELERIRKEQGPQIFSCQYLNNPLPGEIAVFRKEWLKYYKDLPKNIPMRVYMLVDPAISESKTADNRAVIVVGVTEEKDWYIIDYVRGIFPLVDSSAGGRSGRKNLVGEMFRLYEVYKPEFVGIEDVGFQKALKFVMYNEFDQRKINMPLRPMMPRGRETKTMRIQGLAAPFSAGRVYIKDWMKELEEELLGFPMARYKDLIDALSYLCQYEVAPSEPLVQNNDPLLMANILKELKSKKNNEYPFFKQLA